MRVTTILSKWPAEFRHSLDKVYQAARTGKFQQSGHNIMVYFPRADGQVDIICGIEVLDKFEALGEVEYCETPAGLAVTASHIGPYQQLGATHRAIVEWSRENGHRLTGVCWEVYGDWNEDTSQLRTDIFHSV